MTILSFNNDPALKAEHVAQAEHHASADMLISGTYGEGSGKKFRACSVGCFAHDYGIIGNLHAGLSKKFALPEWLWRLRDSMFEGLPQEDRATFHVEFSKRTPVGADLEPVQHWLAIARIERLLTIQRTALEANHSYGVHEAIQRTVIALEVGRRAHEAAARGNACDLSAARSAAESAAESAAAAARSAAESAAAAWSAAAAAWSAAWSAARSEESEESAAAAAWSAARSAAWSAAAAAWSAARSEEPAAARSAARSAAESAAAAARSAARSEESESAARSEAWKAERYDLFAAFARIESCQEKSE